MPALTVVRVLASDLSAAQVYEVWRIRDAVFSVEQNCREEDVDGVDLRDDCVHLWIADDSGQLRSYARVYSEDGHIWLGRVATRASDRGLGLSTTILERVIADWGDQEIAIHAQAHLENWYAKFGFEVNGAPFVEADIDHVPMLRAAGS